MEGKNMELKIESKDFLPIPRKDFKLSAVHYSILKEARNNGGLFDRNKYAAELLKKTTTPEIIKSMVSWNETTIRNMTEAGYMISIGENKFLINPLLEDRKSATGFTPGENHRKLLLKNDKGIIKASELKREHSYKKEYEAKRQYKMIDGMITNLYRNGFLERVDRGVYRLTDSAFQFIDIPNKIKIRRTEKPKQPLKITRFDRHILDVIDTSGTINFEKLNSHPKAKSILTRLETFKEEGLFKDNQLEEELVKRIYKVLEFIKDNQLTLERLTMEQKSVLKDMRTFLNLSFTQISKYIYDGQNGFASTDLEFLVKNKVLMKDEDLAIYILDYNGIRLSNLLEGETAVRYKTKLYSRKEEVEHDMLVYTAYQEFIRSLPKDIIIVSVKNDRQMRSDDSKRFGHMRYGYPDLRVEYKLPGENYSRIYDIELDCGYDGKTVASKLQNIAKGQEALGKKSIGFGWYCRTIGQAAKLAKLLNQDTTKRTIRARKIDLWVLDHKGKLHQIRT